MAEKEELRLIVRIAGKDLNGKKPIAHALTNIKGIGIRYGKIIATVFEKETGISDQQWIGKMPENMDAKLEAIIANPIQHGIPEWMLNRRRDYYTNQTMHRVGGELDFAVRNDIKRMNATKSYKGLRHSWGLTLRGQRTKTSGRKRGSSVGVSKKESKAAAAKPAETKEKK